MTGLIIYYIVCSAIFCYLVFNDLYLLLFAIAGRFRKKSSHSPSAVKKKIAVLIPAYKEDSIIVETAIRAAHHDYPLDCYDVFIIADQLKEYTLAKLSQLSIKVIPVSFDQSTKAKSLKYALKQLPDSFYDILMLLDADNVMQNGCLQKVNGAFVKGFKMIQLHRTAKNKNTPTAILDAMSEEINNHIFRQGHRALGVSSTLIGSGMAFDFSIFKKLMMEADIENNPGEDREINLEMLKRGYVCEYIEDALVYDEKVQSDSVLEKQRTRWISAQLQYANYFWIKGFFKTFSYNFHYFDYAVQTLLLPRIMLLVTTFILFLISILIVLLTGKILFPGIMYWCILFIACMLVLTISLYKRIKLVELLKASLRLPLTIISFFKALLKAKHNQKEFIHTPKDYSSTQEPQL